MGYVKLAHKNVLGAIGRRYKAQGGSGDFGLSTIVVPTLSVDLLLFNAHSFIGTHDLTGSAGAYVSIHVVPAGKVGVLKLAFIGPTTGACGLGLKFGPALDLVPLCMVGTAGYVWNGNLILPAGSGVFSVRGANAADGAIPVGCILTEEPDYLDPEA